MNISESETTGLVASKVPDTYCPINYTNDLFSFEYFQNLAIPEIFISKYLRDIFWSRNIYDENCLRSIASLQYLNEIGIRPDHVHCIMMKLLVSPIQKVKFVPKPQLITNRRLLRSIPDSVELVISKNINFNKHNLIPLCEIARGSSGCVIKAIYAPSLTLLSMKYVKLGDKNQQLVANELKIMYEVARYNNVGDINTSLEAPNQTVETKISLVECPEPCPYLIGYHGHFVDDNRNTVCFILEYMNAGNVQDAIDNNQIFSIDDTVVLAFSVLRALEVLHGCNITHRDLKPSNILIDTKGRIKLADFGIAKGKFELRTSLSRKHCC